jgi:arylformamidase
MRIIDITRPVQEAPVYPGDEPAEIRRVCDMRRGGAYNASVIRMGSHIGTHADADCHYLPDSPVGAGEMGLDRYYGPCRVLTIPAGSVIAPAALLGRVEGCPRVALHGGGRSFLSGEAARCLVQCGIRTVVTDAWSVGPPDREAEVHRILLRAGVAIVENAVLDAVPDGDYTLIAFPIKLCGCDGAPVRAVLLQD